tara:strand:- start:698 stop:1291 length:594 start_codon:yes stop_codon:yes gene_type:complete
MIISALIFFSPKVHHQILNKISSWLNINKVKFDNNLLFENSRFRKYTIWVISIFFIVQILLPWRYMLYPNELFWTEEGYRFSWRVMLMEKAGYAEFKVVDADSGKRFYVNNSDFLTPFQEKQMSFQPDFILQYAHFLADHFRKEGYSNIEVYVESYVGLNGRKSKPYISADVNLLNFDDSFKHKTFILPFNDEIKGL